MLHFLSFLDFYKSPMILYYNGRTKRSSAIGVLFSLMILAFLGYQFFNSEFFSKSSPYVIVQNQQETTARTLNFDTKNPFMFSVFERTSLTKYLEPSLFTIVAIYVDNYNPVFKEIGPCTVDDILFVDQATFNYLNYSSLYCLKNASFVLSGYPDENHFSFLQILLYPCDNATSSVTCRPKEEIEEFFQDKAFAVGYQKSQINFYNYEHPFDVTYDIIYNYADPGITKSNALYLKEVEVITDDGWFFESDHLKTQIAMDKNLPDFELRKSEADPLIKWVIMASKEFVKCSRKYQRLPEVLGGLSGLIQFAIVFGWIFTNFSIHITTLNNVLNKLYYFEDAANSPKIKHRKHRLSASSANVLTPGSFSNDIMTETIKPNKPTRFSRFKRISVGKNSMVEGSEGKLAASESVHDTIKPEDCDMIPDEIIDIKKAPINPEEKEPKAEVPDLSNGGEKKAEDDLPNIQRSPQKNETLVLSPNNLSLEMIYTGVKRRAMPQKTSQPTEGLDIKFWEYFCYMSRKCFRRKNTKEKLIQKAEQAYIHELDVMNIIKKLQDIDNLKLLLLDQEQRILFEHITKPVITKDQIRSTNHLRTFIQSAAEDHGKVVKAYRRCKNEAAECKISQRLVDLCDERWLESS